MKYYRLTNGLNDIGKLIPVTDNPYNYVNQDKDFYLSIYEYDDNHHERFDDIVDAEKVDKKTKEKIKYKRKRGVKDVTDVLTKKLVFDTDSDDLKKAQDDMQVICSRLIEKGLDKSDLNISFSGGKGFSLIVYQKEYLKPEEHKAIAKTLADNLDTFDTKNYNASRVFRLNYTKHQSGFYKTPLTYNQLMGLKIDTIKSLAEKKRKPIWSPKFVELPKEIIEYKNNALEEDHREDVVVTGKVDFNKKPSFLSKAKYVLQCGYIPGGYGNDGMMILCASYKAAGLDQLDAYNLLCSVNDKRAKIYGDSYRRSEDEIVDQVLSTVYNSAWRGGTYSEKETELLQKVREEYEITDKEIKLVSISDVRTRFSEYASNINDNIIKTGIKSLDNELLLTTGMLVGILGAPSAGKCLGKGTEVRMYDGSVKKVENIVVGDVLMGDDSKPRNVLGVCSGKEKLYRVKQRYGKDYVVNKSHILSLKNNVNFSDEKRKKQFQNQIIDINVEEYIKKGKCFKKHYKGYMVGVEYEKKPLELDPYVMGVWLGGGSSSKPDVTTTDKEILNYLNNYFINFDLYPTKQGITYSYTTDRLNRGIKNSNHFLKCLRDYEVFKNKHIPKSYLINSRKNRLKLLAGLIDSDGYYDPNKNSYEISLKNNKLAEGVYNLIRSLGYRVSIKKKVKKYKSFTKNKLYEGESEINVICFSGQDLNKIPVLLGRKKPCYKERELPYDLTPISVIPIGFGEYYGFEIDGNKRFLLGDYTVTHNTSLVTKAIRTQSEKNVKSVFTSLDMHDNLLYMRLIQNATGIDVQSKLRKILKEDAMYDPDYRLESDKDLIEAYDKLDKIYANVDFNFTRGATIESIEQDIIAKKEKDGDDFKFLAVDYLEKVHGPYSDSTALTGYVASRLADLSSKYDLLTFLLLQTQKSSGDPREPLTSMRRIKGASVIEQDCRVVLSAWRPGFNPQDNSDDKYVSIAILKNNMGKLGQLDFTWDGLRGELGEMTGSDRVILQDLLSRIEEQKKETKDDW